MTEETTLAALRLNVGLEPLPKPSLLRRVMPDDYHYGDVFGYTSEQMLAYAKRCVAAERARGSNVELRGRAL